MCSEDRDSSLPPTSDVGVRQSRFTDRPSPSLRPHNLALGLLASGLLDCPPNVDLTPLSFIHGTKVLRYLGTWV